jgi:ribosome-associated protein
VSPICADFAVAYADLPGGPVRDLGVLIVTGPHRRGPAHPPYATEKEDRPGLFSMACQYQGVQEIAIRGHMIRLGQLLKLAELAGSGADARDLLLESGVTVNGEIEVRRGRQLHRGDVVSIGEHTVRVL